MLESYFLAVLLALSQVGMIELADGRASELGVSVQTDFLAVVLGAVQKELRLELAVAVLDWD